MSKGEGEQNEKKRISEKSDSGIIQKVGGGLCGVGGESQHYRIIKV